MGWPSIRACLPPARNQWEAPRWPPAAAGEAPIAAQQGNVVPATAAGVYASVGNQSASFNAPADPRGVAGQPLQRAAADVPQSRGPLVRPAGATVEAPAARGAEQGDHFTVMERKLREYGATYYLLETWGNEGQLYRFHCRMAINNNPNYTRQFEATDRDALRAMSQVLERVEAWRAGRLQ